jgi:hypothetical protein
MLTYHIVCSTTLPPSLCEMGLELEGAKVGARTSVFDRIVCYICDNLRGLGYDNV